LERGRRAVLKDEEKLVVLGRARGRDVEEVEEGAVVVGLGGKERMGASASGLSSSHSVSSSIDEVPMLILFASSIEPSPASSFHRKAFFAPPAPSERVDGL